MLKEGVIQRIVYEKDEDSDDQSAQRYIIPTFVPDNNVKAIDVSELSLVMQDYTEQLVQEYAEYVETASKKIFSFEDWVEHTTGECISPKWRTFKLSGIKIIS